MIQQTLKAVALAMLLMLATSGIGFAAGDEATDEEKSPPVETAPPTDGGSAQPAAPADDSADE